MKANEPLDENEKRRLVLKLVTQLRCAECGQPYDPHDFALVQRRQDMWVLSTRCRRCEQPCHVIVFMRSDSEQELVTDLTPEERKAVDEWPPITADDVLDMHTLLCEFDGDIDSLFDS